ncbi:hypothetical protein GCM10028812_09790 [Ancylobacter sonchi]
MAEAHHDGERLPRCGKRFAVWTRDIVRPPLLAARMISDRKCPLTLIHAFRDDRTELVTLEALNAPEGKLLQV